MRWVCLTTGAILWLACGAGCGSSDDDESTGGSGGSGGGTQQCEPVNVCAAIAPAHVNMLCGLATSDTTLTSRPSTDPTQLPTVSGCDYTGGAGAQVEHECFRSASLASFYFMNEKADTPGGETQMDVAGIGDDAFLRDDAVLEVSRLYVLESNLLIVLTADWSSGGQSTAQQCLQTLAGEALAL